MNESDARAAELVRAFETGPPDPLWSEDDRHWASRSAAQVEGEKASDESLVARRARLSIERLATRSAHVGATLAAVTWKPWIGRLVVASALVAGFLLDAVSAERRINILAPPIIAILAWNLAVYVAMLLRWAWQAARGLSRTQPAPRFAAATRRVSRLVLGVPKSLLRTDAASPFARFARRWLEASSPLNGLRGLALLHLASVAFALGALAGLYLRGLAFEYRAGWESTFLGVDTVRSVLGLVLGPASAVTGIALPDTTRLEAMRLPGGIGENAAGWIHLYAVTVFLFVVVPRVALAAAASLRARRMAERFPLPLDDAYFRHLVRRHRGHAAQVQVVPYSYQLSAAALEGLQRLLLDIHDGAAEIAVRPAVPIGGEDRMRESDPIAGLPASLVVAVFSLSATPEVENHAAFVAALAALLPRGTPLVAIVDESAFRKRFAHDPARIDERRAIWRRILASRRDIAPVFVALESGNIDDASRELSERIDELSGRMVQNAGFRRGAHAPA
jgi:hypothetical protein